MSSPAIHTFQIVAHIATNITLHFFMILALHSFNHFSEIVLLVEFTILKSQKSDGHAHSIFHQ